MEGILIRFLVLFVPGFGIIVAGALNDGYLAIALGGILVIDSVYGVSQKRRITTRNSDQIRQRRSLVVAGVIGASLAIANFASHGYVLAVAGTAILIGALVQLYSTTVK